MSRTSETNIQMGKKGESEEQLQCLMPSFISLSGVWLQRTLPWGTLSSLRQMDPSESDDGPIMWVRPGEQMIPVTDIPKSPFKRKR